MWSASVRFRAEEVEITDIDPSAPVDAFDVEGKKLNVRELRENQRLTAVSFKADPRTLITPDTEITGKSPR